jgi:penicillin-binding protein 2
VQPDVLGASGISAKTLQEVRSGMRDVVMTDRGTGKAARVRGVEMAGKTGTAQAVALRGSNRRARASRDHAWFIAFAPVANPEIAIAVLVEHGGGGGGKLAAPIAKQVLERYFTRDAGPQQSTPKTQEAHAVRPKAAHAF